MKNLVTRLVINIKRIDAQNYIYQVFFVVLFLWILYSALWLLAWILQIESLRVLGLWALSFLLMWVLPILLSFGIKKHSYVALWLVVLIYSLDLGFSIYIITLSVELEMIVYVLIKIVILLFLVRGFWVIGKIKEE